MISSRRAMPRFWRNRYPVATVGVWRSLVARSVRVGEAPSSNLGTPTFARGNPWFPRAPQVSYFAFIVASYAGRMDTQQFPMPYPRGGGGQMFVEHAGNAGGWPDGLSWVMFALLLLLFLMAVATLALALYDRSHRSSSVASSAA